MNTKKKWLFIAVSVVCVAGLLASACAAEPPKMVRAVGLATVSAGFIEGQALLAGIVDCTGVDIRLQPGDKSVDRLKIMKAGEVDFGVLTAGDVYLSMNSLGEYVGMEPQSLRVMWEGYKNAIAYCVPGDSGIKTVQDIKGKKVASYDTYPSVQLYMEAMLAFANYTWDDVVPITVAGYPAGLKAALAGAVDVAFAATTTPAVYEMEKSIHGVYFLPLPPEDTEGWARYKKVLPYFYPAKGVIGPGLSEEKPLLGAAYAMQFACYDDMDKDLAYWLTKHFTECYDVYKEKHKILPYYSLDFTLRSDKNVAPFHDGSVKYFKEIGAWTDENEKKQEELLKKYPQKNTR